MKPILALLFAAVLSTAALAQQPRWVRTGHEGGVTALIFTPDGMHFISSSNQDNRLLVWNAKTGDFERAISLPYGGSNYYFYGYQNGAPFSIAISPDGSTIAVGGDTVIYFIDFTTGLISDSIVPFTRGVYLLQFSLSGDTIIWIQSRPYNSYLLCRYDKAMRHLVDTISFGYSESGGIDYFYQGYPFAISSDASTVAYFDSDSIGILSLKSRAIKYLHTSEASNFSLNSNGSQLAVEGFPSEILDVLTGSVLYTWPTSSPMGQLSYLGHSDTIFYSTADTGIWLHIPDSSTDQFIRIASSNNIPVYKWILSPDHATLVSIVDVASAPLVWPVGNQILMYHKPDFKEMEVTGNCGALTQVRWSPITDTLTVSDMGGGFLSYQASDGVTISRSGPASVRIGGFDYFSNSDSIAYSAFDDDDLENSDAGIFMPSGEIITFPSFGSDIFYEGLTLSPNGKQFIFAGIYDTAVGDVWIPYQKHTNAFAFSPDGSVLLVEDTFGHLATMSTSTMNIAELPDPNHSTILGASFAPNGNEITVVQGDSSVEVLNYPSCTEIYRLRGHTATVTGAMFSHDTRYLITSSDDSTMKIWDLATGQTIYTYSYPSPLVTAGFSHDSKYVAASDGETSVIVWDAPGSLKVEEQPPVPEMTLSQNAPNPASTSTSFSYTIPYSEEVTIGLYDVMGREVRVLANGRMEPGMHIVTLSLETIAMLAPGVYYYRIESASGVATRRMVIE